MKKKGKFFVDWSRSKAVAIVDEKGKEYLVTPKEVEFLEGSEIYLEAGFSAKIMYKILDSGCRVYRVPGDKVKSLRDGEKGTDIEDAHLIKLAYEVHPEWFVEVEKPTKLTQRLRGLYTQYRQVTRDIVRFKNINQAHDWEFGLNPYSEAIEVLEGSKVEIFKQMEGLIEFELRKWKTWDDRVKGVGPMLLAQLLSIAHPRNFSTLSKYLAYVGCKASTFWKEYDPETGKGKGRGRHNWQAKIVGYIMAEGTVKAVGTALKSAGLEKRVVDDKKVPWEHEQIKAYIEAAEEPDPTIVLGYDWYYKIKAQFQEKHPTWSKGICHGKAMNRLRTYIMKQMYWCLKDVPEKRTIDEVFDQERVDE